MEPVAAQLRNTVEKHNRWIQCQTLFSENSSTSLGFGLLRLCTEGRPSEESATELIHFALDQGIRILDTADSYCLDDKDFHYGERLARTRSIELGVVRAKKFESLPKLAWFGRRDAGFQKDLLSISVKSVIAIVGIAGN